MTPKEIAFIQEQRHKIDSCPNPDCESCPDRERLLTILVREVAMREKAEYRLEQVAHSSAYNKPQHDWTDSDWIKAVRERWGVG